MTLRTINKDVTFHNPFKLADLDEVLPAGVYATETEEELLDSLSFTAYRRVRSIIQLQPKSTTTSIRRSMSIDPEELDAALLSDEMATASRNKKSVEGRTMKSDEYFVTGMRPSSTTRQLLNGGFVSEQDAEVYLQRRLREGCRDIVIQRNLREPALGESQPRR